MHFSIITLFPNLFTNFIQESIIGRAIENKKIQIDLINLRDFGIGKHKQVDDTTYGGGAGMLMMPEPIFKAFKSIGADYKKSSPNNKKVLPCQGEMSGFTGQRGLEGDVAVPATEGSKTLRIFMTPQGETLTQPLSEELNNNFDHIILLCGRYEGVDQRVRDELIDQEISIGNYVLSGGELPAMVLLDSIGRLIPGVLGKDASHEQDSFSKAFEGKKEYPQYTKPGTFEWGEKKLEVPEILQSGHHGEIEKWRKKNLR